MGGASDETRDEQAVARFIERFAIDLSEGGFPRMPARVFTGLLIADDGRLTASELAALLQVSPAAISGALRYLTQVGLVGRERQPGRRQDHYFVSDDLWYEAIMKKDEVFRQWARDLEEGVKIVGLDSPAGARLDETRRFFEFVSGGFPELRRRWRELHNIPVED